MPRFESEDLRDLDDLPPTESPKRSRRPWVVLLLAVGGLLLLAVVLVGVVSTTRARQERDVMRAMMEADRARAEEREFDGRGPAVFDPNNAHETARWLRAEVVRISDHKAKGDEFAKLSAELEAAPVGKEVVWRLPVDQIGRDGLVYLDAVRNPAVFDPGSTEPTVALRVRGGVKWTGSAEELRAARTGTTVTFRGTIKKVVRSDNVVTVWTGRGRTRTESTFDLECESTSVGP